jgi:hypothetical protein
MKKKNDDEHYEMHQRAREDLHKMHKEILLALRDKPESKKSEPASGK